MNSAKRSCLLLCLPLGLPLAACLSSAPPAPPVRWFDPSPPAPAANAARVDATFRCRAGAAVAQEFALGVGGREVVYDSEVRWIAPPHELLHAALLSRCSGAGGTEVDVQLLRFAFELNDAATAHVELFVRVAGGGAVALRLAQPCAGKDAAALAEGMAQALAAAVEAVVGRASR